MRCLRVSSAEGDVHYNLTRTDPRLKFPAFWVKGNDYAPDEDNGGNGETAFSKCSCRPMAKKIMLLPRGPTDGMPTLN